MKRTTHLLAIVVAAVAALLTIAGPAAAAPEKHRPLAETVDVKFEEGTDVRLRGGRLVTVGSANLSALDGVLRKFPHVRVERLFSRPEAELAAEEAELEKKTGRKLADLNLFFRFKTDGKDEASQLVDALDGLGVVEEAYPSALPAPPAATPSYTSMQGYRSVAPTGIDVSAAAAYAGGKGDRVKVVDIEYAWNLNHEDLAGRVTFIPSSAYPTDGGHGTHHGTAVLGELIGKDNGFGVTGLVPNASAAVVNALDTYAGYNPAKAIDTATANMSRGDVMLIEQQMRGWNCPATANPQCYVPMEWDAGVFAAISRATAAGIIVVEAAGNGNQNLDDPYYAARFGPNAPDSGAIIVGAGGSGCRVWGQPARSRLSFSTYGSRVNVHGWGECVTTTGYGDLFGGGMLNSMYTNTFGGTSSASPIVAAAATVLSSAVETARGVNLTSKQVRSILMSTGTPQDFTTTGALGGRIGPLPNLKAALANQLGSPVTDTVKPVVSVPSQTVSTGWSLGTTAVPVTISWSGSDLGGSGLARYVLWQSTNGAAYQQVTLSSALSTSIVRSLEPGSSYSFVVDAIDGAGNENRVYGSTFTVDAHQETSTAIAYTGSWSRNAWASAYGGFEQTASVANASAKLTFTGRSVAWIAPKATNRGRVHLYLDGVFVGTVDQYAVTTTARMVLFSRTFATAGTHTLTVVAEGTTSRPSVDVDAFVVLR